MGRFQVVPNAVAVASDRLVAIIHAETNGSVTVRDLVNGRIHTVSAAELTAPPHVARLNTSSAAIISAATDSQWGLAQQRKDAIAAAERF